MPKYENMKKTILNSVTQYAINGHMLVSVSINQLLNGLYSLFSCSENHVLKGATMKRKYFSHGTTIKGKNMLPIFFPLRVAPMRIENNLTWHYEELRQYVSLLKSPNFDSPNIKCFTVDQCMQLT